MIKKPFTGKPINKGYRSKSMTWHYKTAVADYTMRPMAMS